MTTKWTAQKDMPDQSGRVVIVTGANGGLGYESALALARKGAKVIVASRNQTKGHQAVSSIKAQLPEAQIEFIQLDLASLASVQAFAEEFKRGYDRLDILLNNAGVMAIPRQQSADGFEMQFGTNHLGHFALTGQLLELLIKTPGSRIINTSSSAQLFGRMYWEDLQLRQNYGRWKAYGQSKLANVLFTFELQRRLAAASYSTISLSAHPGYASTNLQHTSANTSHSRLDMLFYSLGNRVVAQSAAMGALPQLYAATAPQAGGGEFYGPHLFIRGYPKRARVNPGAYDEAAGRRLWELSEELTGVHYSFGKQFASAEKA